MGTIARNLLAVRARMLEAALQAGREPASVRLLAVSKGFPASAVAEAHAAGQFEFGENYLQEALPKLASLKRLADLEWHFIGTLQGNKTRPVAENFAWVHAIDRERIAQRLSHQRPAWLPALNVCIEVRLGEEPGKSGVAPELVPVLARHIAELPRLRLRGLMCIPPPADDTEVQRARFRRMRELFEMLKQDVQQLDTLSMGMSGDYQAAILEGATMIRVGSAIFGQRPSQRS
ncbi:MAG: YggS family pyridoxal phosphate-dependent enzyme [Gammaproteobacteria bacterium]|nr:YggS family pyridoxal phosphate-dependent enzyme [Gammaproteobacteria bacterium]